MWQLVLTLASAWQAGIVSSLKCWPHPQNNDLLRSQGGQEMLQEFDYCTKQHAARRTTLPPTQSFNARRLHRPLEEQPANTNPQDRTLCTSLVEVAKRIQSCNRLTSFVRVPQIATNPLSPLATQCTVHRIMIESEKV